jgi:hypothetical protein
MFSVIIGIPYVSRQVCFCIFRLYLLCKWNALCSRRLCCNLCDRETGCESYQKLRFFFFFGVPFSVFA